MITLRSQDIESKFFTFSGGERHINIYYSLEDIPYSSRDSIDVNLNFKSSDDLIDLLLLSDTLKREGIRINKLTIPYLPYARQDRHTNIGESFALSSVAANIIKLANPRILITADLHSPVLFSLLEGTDIKLENWSQKQLMAHFHINDTSLKSHPAKKDTCLISPDAGASKKTEELGNYLGLPVIQALKNRSTVDGRLSNTFLSQEIPKKTKEVYIVDDICDGGATFINLAIKIRETGYKGKLRLIVTHGIFSKGLIPLLEHFDSVEAIFSHLNYIETFEEKEKVFLKRHLNYKTHLLQNITDRG